MMSTLCSAHSLMVYVELTDDEIKTLEQFQHDNKVFGNEEDSERTYVEIRTLEQVLLDKNIDWTNLRMIAQYFLSENL